MLGFDLQEASCAVLVLAVSMASRTIRSQIENASCDESCKSAVTVTVPDAARLGHFGNQLKLEVEPQNTDCCNTSLGFKEK